MRDKLTVGAFRASALTIVLTLGGIMLFLFREGVPALTKEPFEGLVFAVHPQNPVRRLSADECRALFQKSLNWSEVGGPAVSPLPIHLYNLELYVGSQASLERIRSFLDSVAQLPGILVALPRAWVPASLRPVEVRWSAWEALFGRVRWSPTYEPLPEVGIWPLLLGSLWVTFLALLITLPSGVIMAIYTAEFLPKGLYYPMKVLWEVVAGLPSVVVGFWGLVVLVPWLQKAFHLHTGETALAAALLLGWMTIPLMASLVEEALSNVPRLLVEASYGLGATPWQTILRVKLPAIRSALLTATLLSAGRILGETMIVLIVSGNAPLLPTTPLSPVRTLPATLAAELGEAPVGSYHYHTLFFLGLVLFLLTLALNILAYAITPSEKTA
jgi:phosphate transport system permease protein